VASFGQGQESFGRLALQAASAGELLELERARDRAKDFLPLDSLIGRVAIRALCGERPFSVKGVDKNGAPGRTATLRLKGLSGEKRLFLEELFSLEKQKSRGSWSLPETVRVRLGRLHFPAHLQEHGRYFHESVETDYYRLVALAASPEALLAHVILDPFFSSLYEPFMLRTDSAFRSSVRHGIGHYPSEERRLARWQATDAFFSSLGLEAETELSALRPGGGGARLPANEQLAAMVSLTQAIRREAQRLGPSLLGARYRAYRLRPLLDQYYAKANKEGRALRQRVLTRKLDELTLSAFFGGDWLAFLNYLGEEPHPEEHVATALPKTRLYLGSPHKAKDLGVEGVSEEQLKLIAISLYGGEETSPVERRVSALKRYWEAFDAIHARQRSGMESLWSWTQRPGLLGFSNYRRLMPADVLEEVDELWGTAMYTREPGRIATNPVPQISLAYAFGPALQFWHRCAYTAWILCDEGPELPSMADLERAHSLPAMQLAKLDNLGTPVDRKMFVELIAVEESLEPKEPIYGETEQIEVEPGITTETQEFIGYRREGFERLRDVITKYRRAWAQKHLDAYLRSRAESDVREAARTYHRKTAERGGKPPTFKQFAGYAVVPTNRWFGGDVSAFYRTFGEKSPVSSERLRLVPEDANPS
jgi:hypothetical protein